MTEKKLLFDYYAKTIGTPEEQSALEIALYENTADSLQMEIYAADEDDNEGVKQLEVSADVLDRVMEIVKRRKMYRWNDEDGISIDGKLFVCKFWHNDECIRVSSENMPDNGVSTFGKILETLMSAKPVN